MTTLALDRWQVAALYFRVTPPLVRSHDVGGHLQHVGLIGTGDLVPEVGSSWQCHHPTLYYWVAAAVLGFPTEPSPRDQRKLQLLSLAFYAGFLIASARVLTLLCGCRIQSRFATAILCLWPAGIAHSVRIGNDDLSYLLFALAFLALASWLERDAPARLLAACG